MIMGYGMTNGLEIYVQDQKGGDIETLFSYTKDFVAALGARPEIQSAVTTFDTRFPQYLVEVDAASTGCPSPRRHFRLRRSACVRS